MCAGGHQFKVTANDLIVVNRIQAEVGSEIFLEKVCCTVTSLVNDLESMRLGYIVYRCCWLAQRTSL